jgi:sec-independent protein translocase protein TatB
MFDSIGWAEILVLVVAGLFILGPERLPTAAAWLGRTVRQVREYATGAREQLRAELGPDFDELRKPLEDLRGIRNLNPRRMVSRSLFEDDDIKPNGYPSQPPSSHVDPPAAPSPRVVRPLAPGERPPIDPDAT